MFPWAKRTGHRLQNDYLLSPRSLSCWAYSSSPGSWSFSSSGASRTEPSRTGPVRKPLHPRLFHHLPRDSPALTCMLRRSPPMPATKKLSETRSTRQVVSPCGRSRRRDRSSVRPRGVRSSCISRSRRERALRRRTHCWTEPSNGARRRRPRNNPLSDVRRPDPTRAGSLSGIDCPERWGTGPGSSLFSRAHAGH